MSESRYFKQGDKVVWTLNTPHNESIYPRQTLPTFGELGSFQEYPYPHVEFESGAILYAHDCKMMNVRHACDQADRHLTYPLTVTEDLAKYLLSEAYLQALEWRNGYPTAAERLSKAYQLETGKDFTFEEAEAFKAIHERNMLHSGY